MNDPRIIAVLWDLRKLRDTLKALQEKTSGTARQRDKDYRDGQLVAIDTTVSLIFHRFPGLDLGEFQDAQ